MFHLRILGAQANWTFPCSLRRANFTSADMREADFSGSIFVGGYLEKAVAFKTNFAGDMIAFLPTPVV